MVKSLWRACLPVWALSLVLAPAADAQIINFTTTLTVSVSGSGTVTGTGINCPGDCSQNFNFLLATSVTLTATPAAGNVFAGWGGDCSGTGGCTVTMTANRTVSARFVPVLTFTVNSTADAVDANPGNDVCATATGVCTLRAAIMEANARFGGDTIILPAGTYTLTIPGTGEDFAATGDLDIRQSTTISGAGAATTIIDGGGLDRVFDIIAGTVNISGVTIRNGSTPSTGFVSGGGIQIQTGGTLTLTNVTVSGNRVDTTVGGGISNLGTLTLTNVTVSGNSSNSDGGGISNLGTATLTDVTIDGNSAAFDGDGGGIINFGTAMLTNVTIRDNAARFLGGGIFNRPASAGVGGSATLTNVTVSGNISGQGDGGGIANQSGGSILLTNVTINGNSVVQGVGGGIHNQGTATLKNTIVANNVDRLNNVIPNCFGTIISAGHNLDSGTSCGFTAAGDLVNTDPRLGPLVDNGGPTQTHALLPGSPAIDAGDNAGCPMTDQRGVPRPQDGNGDGLATCDIGAFEATSGTASLVAAVLPSSRSVQVGTPATAFATIINAGNGTAFGVSIAPRTVLPANFTFQTTDPATNVVTGMPNTAVDIPAGRSQSFVIALAPTAPIAPTEVEFNFAGTNTTPVGTLVGINTLLFSASATPVPDIVALAATLNNDGIVNIPGPTGTGVFAVATVNVGASEMITASADTGGATLPVILSLCETNPTTGACISPISSSVTTTIAANATPTFGIFVTGTGTVPFDPAVNRIFVRFKDAGGVTRGSTSVAVRTQ